MARNACNRAHREGRLTHAHVFEEEACEVLNAQTPEDLRKELVQVGAMCLKWVLDIDGRAAGSVEPVVDLMDALKTALAPKEKP